MGHSTGSQDVIHYLTSPSSSSSPRPKVDGGIMQAPASDREYFSGGDDTGINAWLSNLPIAEGMMKDGKGDQVMDDKACEAMGIRITAYRLWSLLSEVCVLPLISPSLSLMTIAGTTITSHCQFQQRTMESTPTPLNRHSVNSQSPPSHCSVRRTQHIKEGISRRN